MLNAMKRLETLHRVEHASRGVETDELNSALFEYLGTGRSTSSSRFKSIIAPYHKEALPRRVQ